MALPRRPRQHVLETESRNNLNQNIPNEWVVQNIDNDYGIDNLVEIVNDEELNGNFFSIQLKGTDTNFNNQDSVTVRMNTRTIRYLMNRVELVMIVLYVSTEEESYWTWLRDAIEGINYDNQTFTIRIPKVNILSAANWQRISDFSETIRNRKVNSAMDLNFNYEEE